jgi:hypothetical protein
MFFWYFSCAKKSTDKFNPFGAGVMIGGNPWVATHGYLNFIPSGYRIDA